MCDRRNPEKGFRQGWHIDRRASRLRRAERSEVHREFSWLLDDNGDTIMGLARETAAAALHFFRFKVLMKGKWDAAKGASLATFFVGQCRLQFANVYNTAGTPTSATTDWCLTRMLATGPKATGGLPPLWLS